MKTVRKIRPVILVLILVIMFNYVTDPKLMMYRPIYSEKVLEGKTIDEVIQLLGEPAVDTRRGHNDQYGNYHGMVGFGYFSGGIVCGITFKDGRVIIADRHMK